MEFPSFTKKWHNTTYPSINPSNAALSAAGKTVVITGGGAGVGRSISQSFAVAGAATILITGRTEKTLLNAKKEIEAAFPKTKVQTYAADITDEQAVKAAFSSLGRKIDILVHNAGYLPDMEPISTTLLAEWWRGFEVNVKGSFVVTQAFLEHAAQDAVLVNLTSGVAHLPSFPHYSSYASSKLGAVKFFDGVQAENPDLRVVTVHPGVIKSDMSDKSKAHGEVFPFDDASLPSNFIVWVASPEGAFLQGKNVWVNWDVDELKAGASKIKGSLALTTGLLGLMDTGFTNLTNPV